MGAASCTIGFSSVRNESKFPMNPLNGAVRRTEG
jgi:hypothetical protein